ncbi:MAG: MmgE/PrpD family protein [Kiloniellales bacterium]|nr:MmgE/PrpD family protein [Kiloniellales bacterium]
MTTIAEHLADWSAKLEADAVPPVLRATLRRLLLDSGGLMVAARDRDYVTACRETTEAPGACTVIGQEGGFLATDAALISGVAIHGEDYDDTFEGTPLHVSAVILPAALTAAEKAGASGADLLRGLATGGELACRMAVVAPTAIHRAGFHPTAVIGTLSATFSASTIFKLEPRQTVSALGIAGSLASGIIEYLAEGTSTKRLHPGWAAQSGLRAAELAAQGFSGPRTVFEGEHGFFRAFAAPEIRRDDSRLTDGLGETWLLESLAFKPYACGTMVQPFIDAAIALREGGVKPEQIAEITAPTAEGIVHRLWEPLAEKARPSTAFSAKFSVPFGIALGLSEGLAGLAQFTPESIADPQLLVLASKVRYAIDPADPYPENYVGEVRALLTNGETVSARQPHLRGGRREPLSDDEIHAKFRANVDFGGWPGSLARAYESFCDEAFDLPSLAALEQFRN